MAAGEIVPVPSIAEIEGQQDGYAKARWTKYEEELQQRWQARNAAMQGMTEQEREAYREEQLWSWMEEDDAARKAVLADIDDFARKLQEELRNRKVQQERLAFSLSRFSPASAYQLLAMNLAGTNIGLKARYEDAMSRYRTKFVEYREKKQKENGGGSGIRISLGGDDGFRLSTGRETGSLDLSDMPRFEAPDYPLSDALAPTVVDFGLLALYLLTAFSGAFVVFLRYDVR